MKFKMKSLKPDGRPESSHNNYRRMPERYINQCTCQPAHCEEDYYALTTPALVIGGTTGAQRCTIVSRGCCQKKMGQMSKKAHLRCFIRVHVRIPFIRQVPSSCRGFPANLTQSSRHFWARLKKRKFLFA